VICRAHVYVHFCFFDSGLYLLKDIWLQICVFYLSAKLVKFFYGDFNISFYRYVVNFGKAASNFFAFHGSKSLSLE